MDGDSHVAVKKLQRFRIPHSANKPIVTWALLGLNATIWIIASVIGDTENPDVLLDLGAMFGPLISAGQYWRLFTAMFLHIGGLHLAFNSLGLLIFGPLVERSYGHFRFLTIYILAGLTGSVTSYLANSIFGTISIAAGSSGAVFGILGALAAYFTLQGKSSGKASQQNLTGLLLIAGINLVYGLATPSIDNWAHLGGLAGGSILGLSLVPQHSFFRDSIGTPVTSANTNHFNWRWLGIPLTLSLLLAGTILATSWLPRNPYSHLHKAQHHWEQLEHQMAMKEIDKALELDNTLAEAYYIRGIIYTDQGNINAAISELAQAIKYGQVNDKEILQRAIQALIDLRS